MVPVLPRPGAPNTIMLGLVTPAVPDSVQPIGSA